MSYEVESSGFGKNEDGLHLLKCMVGLNLVLTVAVLWEVMT